MRFIRFFAFFSLLISSIFTLSAIPALRVLLHKIQNDGLKIDYYLKGDEQNSCMITTDGYLLTEDMQGNLAYAKILSDGRIISTERIAHSVIDRTSDETAFLTQIPVYNVETPTLIDKNNSFRVPGQSQAALPSFPLVGSPKTLVILAAFSDLPFTVENPKTSFSNMLNQHGYAENGATGSAIDYFTENSMGTFTPQFDVAGPFTLSGTQAFYGADDAFGNKDLNAQIMVKDACRVAFEGGVKFNNYDYDNDGYVDNIFIYYAGYNQAEGASANTIWPQRNALPDKAVRYNTKYISNYSYTSELRFYPESAMCGIGTFCHEFGHVLGLHDLYPSNGKNHYTLGSSDIMDYGAYLNKGRTPPSYSALERFSLGWLTPVQLTWPRGLQLTDIKTSNEAFLISNSDNHNLNGTRPDPIDYFLLENRQQTGWDSYLPSHGLMITRVHFDSVNWAANAVNNNTLLLGVDIMEADGTGSTETQAMDFFPSGGVDNFQTVFANGTLLHKDITGITEENGQISFHFMGGYNKLDSPDNDIFYLNASEGRAVLWSKITGIHQLEIFDITGRKIFQKEFSDKVEIILRSGVYLIRLDDVLRKISM